MLTLINENSTVRDLIIHLTIFKSRDFSFHFGKGPRTFQIGKINTVNPSQETPK